MTCVYCGSEGNLNHNFESKRGDTVFFCDTCKKKNDDAKKAMVTEWAILNRRLKI